MSAELIDDAVAVPVPRGRRPQVVKPVPSTSIRVSVATRDALAKSAATAGMSLNGYLAKLARRAWREQALNELRQERLEAFKDPVFVAEMKEWDEADDGIDFQDDGWPEFNEPVE